MQCVILAAGRGSRLSRSDSKPLTPLLGVPLIERTMRTALMGGATEFIVVTGYKADFVRDFVTRLGRDLSVPVRVVHNPEWEELGNGRSLWHARAALADGPFLLLMADHLFEAEALLRLREAEVPSEGLLLAVDRGLDRDDIDLEDVTKVLEEEGKIRAIGKELADYNAFDSGLFLCTPAIFGALERAFGEGQSGLSAAVMQLAAEGRARTVDITGIFWADVDDERAFQRAEEGLLCRVRGKTNDGPVSRLLNRPISIRISRHLARTPVTPNQISLACFALSVVAAGLMLYPAYLALLAGGLLAQFASIVDGCDGEIARLKFQGSAYGGWLDAVLDRYADSLLLSAMALHGWQVSGSIWPVVAGFAAVTGSLVLSYTADKYDGLMKERLKDSVRLGRDLRILILSIGALLNQPLATLLVIAVIMNAEVVRRLVICRDSP